MKLLLLILSFFLPMPERQQPAPPEVRQAQLEARTEAKLESTARGRTVIDLGSGLFQSGSDEFRSTAAEDIDRELLQLPDRSRLVVEAVFSNPRRSGAHQWNPRQAIRLFTLRAEALRTSLEARGWTVEDVIFTEIPPPNRLAIAGQMRLHIVR